MTDERGITAASWQDVRFWMFATQYVFSRRPVPATLIRPRSIRMERKDFCSRASISGNYRRRVAHRVTGSTDSCMTSAQACGGRATNRFGMIPLSQDP
jgi:hypothetical protein